MQAYGQRRLTRGGPGARGHDLLGRWGVGMVMGLVAFGLLWQGSARGAGAAGEAFRGGKAGEEREVSGVKICWCPPDKFLMGSPLEEPDRRVDEGQVEVRLNKGFWMGKFEVTQGEWKRVMGDFPGTQPAGEGVDFPLVEVNYPEALAFCRKLTEMAQAEGKLPGDWQFHLATEAQWEYACRAGTTSLSAFGSALTSANANLLDRKPPPGRATPVGRYPANAWGLHDMHGNVFEWCRDWYHAALPGGDDPDLSGIKGVMNRDGTYSRVRRGGAWNDAAMYCRSAMRLRYEPPRRSDHIGFRVVVVESRTVRGGLAYEPRPGFLQVPGEWTLEQVSAVALDAQGNLFAFNRGKHPVASFDPQGKFLRAFGEGMGKSSHGLRFDHEGNVWTTDWKDHAVRQFSADGRLLRTLGEPGRPGTDDQHFNQPTDIVFAPNGEFYISDGYGNSRVLKFDRTGKLLFTWGKKGKGEGEFDLPHAVQLDSQGLVYVGDRENNRIQVFDSKGKFIRQFGGMAPYGLFITADDILFIADGRANKVIVADMLGNRLTEWGKLGSEPGNFMLPHGIAVGPDGAVYVAEVNGKRVQKFIRK